MENRLLEKMTQIEPRSLDFIYRGQYYKNYGNAQKPEEDEITGIVRRLEETGKEIEKTPDARRKAILYAKCGDLHYQLRQYEKAVANYETAIAFDPNVVFATFRLSGAKLKPVRAKDTPNQDLH